MPTILCSRCGYDLRQHELNERCPECGADVALVFKEHPWWSGEMQVVLRRGLRWLAGSLAVLLLAPLLIWPLLTLRGTDALGPLEKALLTAVWIVVQQALWLRALWLITPYNHREVAGPRMVLRIGMWGMTGGLGLLCAATLLPLPAVLTDALTVVAWSGITMASGCTAGFLGRLARLMDAPAHMWQFRGLAFVLGTTVASGWAAAWIGFGTSAAMGAMALWSAGVIVGWLAMLWLMALCAIWGRELHKENVALGMGR
jgi:hypothetical protein